jgi:hypothetical protein
VKSTKKQVFESWRRFQPGVLGFFLSCLFLSKACGQLGLPPIILVPPLDQTVQNGGNGVFSVLLAASLTPLTYQWRFNGVDIPGATGSSYTRSYARNSDEGMYSVKVSNGSGSVPSSAAKLTVVSTPLRFVSCSCDNTGFKGQIKGALNANYVVLASTDLRHWTPISTNFVSSGTLDFIDHEATNYAIRYYNVRTQ